MPRGYAPSPENFFNFLLKNGVFWSILMSKCASHVYTWIAYFHFHQYKPTSYNYTITQNGSECETKIEVF